MRYVFGPRKSDFLPILFFSHFPIEIPMHLQICIFRPQECSNQFFFKETHLKFNFTLKTCEPALLTIFEISLSPTLHSEHR